MSNTPPLFKNFGKSFTDLLDKKFDFDRDVKIKTTSVSGVSFETTVRASSKSSDFIGLFKGIFKRPDFGTVETNLTTDGKVKVSLEMDKIRPGLVAKLTSELDTANIDMGYSREYVATSVGVTAKQNNYYLDESLALGYEGLSIGTALKYNVNSSVIEDFNVGTKFAQPDFTIALKTAESQQKITGSYIHNVSPDVVVGGCFAYNLNPKTPSNVLSLVASYALDRDASAKVKFSSNGILTGAWEQRVFNPKLKIGLATEYLLKNQSPTLEKLGCTFTFGDN